MWSLRAAAVSGAEQAERLQADFDQPHIWKNKKQCLKVFHVTDFFPRLDKAGFSSRVLHGVGRAWGLSACESSVRFTGPLEATTPE